MGKWEEKLNCADDGSYTEVVDGKIVVRSIYDDDEPTVAKSVPNGWVQMGFVIAMTLLFLGYSIPWG